MSDKPQIASTTAAKLTAAGSGVLVSSLLFSVYLLVPPLGLVTCLLAPFPAVFVRLRHGRGAALIVTLAAAAMLAALFGPLAALVYLLQCSVIALLLPELLVRGFGPVRTIAWTTAVTLVAYLLAALAFVLISGQNIHQLIAAEIKGSVAQAMNIYGMTGLKGDELAAMKQSMTMAAELLVRIYPALLTVMLIAMAGCNLSLVKRFSSRFGFDVVIGDFKQFRNPELLIWLLITAGFAMLAGNPLVTTPALNVLVILMVLYFVQGLAVISTVISRQRFAGAMRLGLYLVLLLQPYMAALVAAIGIFDLWGDFRTPRKQENL